MFITIDVANKIWNENNETLMKEEKPVHEKEKYCKKIAVVSELSTMCGKSMWN